MNKNIKSWVGVFVLCLFLCQCQSLLSPEEELEAVQQRNEQIAHEPTGKFFYGHRYYIPHTRFWGYVRQPRQRWSQANLVVVDESVCKVPDRLQEVASTHKKYKENQGYDAHFDYKLYGYYTGKAAYEPNTNLALPIFKLTGYEVLSEKKNWLFTPNEREKDDEVSLYPGLVPSEAR